MQPYRPAYRNPSPDPDQDLAMLPPQNNYYSPVNPSHHQLPPQHQQQRQPHPHDDPYYSDRDYVPHHPGQSDVTTGADNYGHGAAGGGMTGLASGVAAYPGQSRRHLHDSRAYEEMGYQETMGGNYEPAGYDHGYQYQQQQQQQQPPHHANSMNNGNYGNNNYGNNNYGNDRYNAYQENANAGPARYHYEDPYRRDESSLGAVHPESINPHDIVDDGDDGFMPEPKRRSILSIGHNSSHNNLYAGAVPVAGASGSLPGSGSRSPAGGASSSGNIGGNSSRADAPLYNLATGEKKVFADEERSRKKRLWIIGIIVALVIAGAIAGGVTAGILANKAASSDPNRPGHSGSDDDSNGDLGKDSKEIKALQSNDLHKVFPGMDYTPWGTQYPLCLKYPPSQNNVTRDIAVLSQLTNTVRLYGTDCNQTEMVLHAFKRLELPQMKLWLGVWIDTNTTTNDRQIEQLYKILENTPDKSVFKGVIVGNEVLYRGKNDPSTITQLMGYIKGVKDELSKLNLKLPIATSDLGDAWTQPLTKIVDVVMSNVHPFFAGVTSAQGTGWAWSFWTEHDVVLTKGTDKKQIISEIGWPSGGGNNCGMDKCPDSTSGSVASVKDLNIFMDHWVCEALSNGTDYFWFEAFDEPWKVRYNEPGKEWEDKWGLMDPGRVLKPGIKIPDCGGKTIN
ncbi:endo-beta-1,3-glucanase [Nannizzia gypsea CBS 118893]|uniref:glucan endo-1,3-beta-D-glucosidase n=1 Tax=Arthroderma gypseum (strain ATCC MYA-4604 / CBS 118893) TaxID=535722 RepID=E4UUG5_ARTGP|nr:endo-beta-1,3-glucanase [Nannizzia gypsea CBS 118893]EFR00932.1 endo-beta-1,3-glucanase [Nannizzia gypsea CBS 118893]